MTESAEFLAGVDEGYRSIVEQASRRWSRIERVTRPWSEMTDKQLADEASNMLAEALGRTDEFVRGRFQAMGMRNEVRADDAIYAARKLLKEKGFNAPKLQRSVGSDDYVDCRTKKRW